MHVDVPCMTFTAITRSMAAVALIGGLVLASTTAEAVAPPSGVTAPSRHQAGWKLKFVDDFTSLDTARWARYDSPHKGGDMGIWAPSQVRVAGGALKLVNTYDRKRSNWLTGGVSLKGQSLRYGKVVVRLRHEAGAGTRGVALLWPDANASWPPEIDFYETGADSPTRTKTMVTNHYKTKTAPHLLQQAGVKRDFKKWSTVAVEWTPTSLTYKIEGVVTARHTGHSPNTRMHLALQTETASRAAGRAPSSAVPSHALVIDWVALYSYDPGRA